MRTKEDGSTELMNVASLKTVPNVVRSTRERTDDSSFAWATGRILMTTYSTLKMSEVRLPLIEKYMAG